MQQLKRFRELFRLFFKMVREDGLGFTLRRAAGFARRRLRSKKGRFLPPRAELERERREDTAGWPKISICTALYNTNPQYLREFLASFLAQSYENCELCLADASDSDHSDVRQIVADCRSDRIRYQRLDRNAGISENTNAAAKMATGSYLALADHDDILSPNACYELAKAAAEGADFIYSDEALFGGDYLRPRAGHFKPDYSVYDLRGCNYICHIAAFPAERFWQVGGLRAEFDGSQDHDLFFRLTETAKKIRHIPRVLYYWRVHEGSTSGGVGAKPYVTAAAKRAIDAHLARVGVAGHAEDGLFPSTYRVDYEIAGEPLVSILIPNMDHVEELRHCLESVYAKTSWKRFEVVVIENNSTQPETFRFYEEQQVAHENLKVVRYEGGFNFSAINNFGRRSAGGDYLVLLNNDIEIISPDWIEQMLMLAQQPEVGAVGAMLYYPDNTIQHAGVITGLGGYAGHSHKYAKRGHSGYMFRLATVQEFSAVTAAMLMIRTEHYDLVNGLDESFAVAFNDVDFCLRLRRAGLHNLFTPFAEAYHCESKSRGLDLQGAAKERFEGEQARLKERYGDALLQDPFYNPNLTLDMENFAEAAVLPKYPVDR